MNYRDLDKRIQENVQAVLESYFKQRFEINECDDFYSQSGMWYGYVAINEKTREVLVCDSTPDDGDTLIKIVRF